MMKTLLTTSLLSLSVFSIGCGGGFALRSPEQYRDDTAAVFESKAGDLKACYDAVLAQTPGVGGSVTVNFKWSSEDGTLQEAVVDNAASTAPEAVVDCVTKTLVGLTLVPPDQKVGEGTWTFEFTAPPAATPAAPAPAASIDVQAPKS